MKSRRQRIIESRRKLAHEILKQLNIKKTIANYGLRNVKHALSMWLNYQRETAKLLGEKRKLEVRLEEISKKQGSKIV